MLSRQELAEISIWVLILLMINGVGLLVFYQLMSYAE